MTDLIFVHGTGVRRASFDATFETVRAALPGWAVHPCFWGGEHGVKLHHKGASIPDYQADRRSEENKVESQWELLYQDPLCELRQSAGQPGAQRRFSFNELPEWEELKNFILAYQPTEALAPLLDRAQLRPVWPEAFEYITRSKEFDAAVEKYTPEDESPVALVARAVIAAAIAAGVERGFPLPDADARDALVEQLAADFGQPQYKDVIETALFSYYLRPLTWFAERERAATSDAAFPAAGDILLYQRRGHGIRDCIEAEIHRVLNESADGRVVLLAHSLGGIACFDLLAQKPDLPVRALVTAGSQAPLLYEMDCLCSLRHNEPLPKNFPRWLNVFDRQDLLSYVGQKLFPGQVEDFEVKSGQPFPISHSAYWQMEALWKRVSELVE